MRPHAPIGVFDSGVGGLSVLRALQAELPDERFVYVADNGHAPYGERDDAHVLQRSHVLADYLRAQHHIKALVVACNTATAAAIHTLRAAYTDLPIVGIEPALKPALARSHTGVVGVMATRGTLNSEKFHRLLDSLEGSHRVVLQPCDGLADAIERADADKTLALCRSYTQAMGAFGEYAGQIDCLVLGCTHYAFAAEALQQLIGPATALLDAGVPVAKQTRRVLAQGQALAAPGNAQAAPTQFYSTGNVALLNAAVQGWLHCDAQAQAITPGGA